MSSHLCDPKNGTSTTLNSVTLDEEATVECSVPPPAPHSDSTGLSHACFFSLALCIIVTAFDSTMVPTTIPTLTTAFHVGHVVQLVSPVYLLGATSFQMLYGRFSDAFGRKISISVAMFVFIVGSLSTGFSTTLAQLLISRAISGVGGGGIISLVQIAVTDMVSTQERPKVQTIIGGLIAFGYAIGPLIGGAFLEKDNWRWCFWISTPISVCALVTVIFTLPSRQIAKEAKSILPTIDFIGAILILCGCISMILPLIWGGLLFSWDSPAVLAPLFCGLIILVIFCIWEWKGPKGARLLILPMYIFKYRTVTGVYITTFLYGFIHFSSLYYLPQYLRVMLGHDPIRTGVFFIPFLITTIALSWLASFVVSRTRQYKIMINCGYVILTMACGVVLAFTKIHIAQIVALMIVAGAGAGQTLQTPIVAVQARVAKEDMAAVTAFRNFIRCLGGTFTLAVGSSIIDHYLKFIIHSLALPPSVITTIIKDPSRSLSSPSTLALSPSTASLILEHGHAKGFKMIFVLNAVLAVVATLVSLLMVRDSKLITGLEGDPRSIDAKNASVDVPRTTNGDIEKATETICEDLVP